MDALNDINAEGLRQFVSLLKTITERVAGDVTIYQYSKLADRAKSEGISRYGYYARNPAGYGSKHSIFINDGQPLNSQIATYAHEFGHVLLGHLESDFNERYSPNDGVIREEQADLFAAMFTFLLEGALPMLKDMKCGVRRPDGTLVSAPKLTEKPRQRRAAQLKVL